MTNVHNNSFPPECAGLESVTKPLLHPESFAKLNAYRQKLERGGLSLAANRLQA